MAESGNRLLYIDNLRWLTILSVIVVHSAVTYGPVGGWFYHDRAVVDGGSDILLIIIPTFMQAFFMGLLFLLAGYFVPGSFQRKGGDRFIRDRAFRLGLPALLFMLVIAPLTILAFLPVGTDPAFLSNYLVNPANWDSGPLWFAIALLAFCLAYLLVREATSWRVPRLALTQRLLVLLASIMILSTIAVRVFFPIGTDIWNMQLCFFPQYVVLFLFGVMAYHNNWLDVLDRRLVRPWVYLAVALSFTLWPALIALGGAIDGDTSKYAGGLEWQAIGLVVWEQLFCMGAVLGLLSWSKRRFNGQGRWSKLFSDNAFAMYVFQTPVLVGLGVLLAVSGLPVLLKFLALAILGLVITLGLSHFLFRRVPYLKEIL
jgi:peptidoglycan/LPS O-acetylase OafA/YrhL